MTIAGLLESLCCGSASALIVAAHPDDEVIGAGAQLPLWQNVSFVCVTDGAPRDLQDTRAAGFTCREDYAQARRRELQASLKVVAEARGAEAELSRPASPEGLSAQNAIPVHELGFVDQEATLNLTALVFAL